MLFTYVDIYSTDQTPPFFSYEQIQNKRSNLELHSFQIILATLRSEYEYKIDYEYDFRI